MRPLTALGALCGLLLLAAGAAAETRIFVIANSPDGYGVDQCLATGARCGSLVANAYCQSRDYLQAASFRRVDAGEITNSTAAEGAPAGAVGDAFVAIECAR
jgi:hypothetical protein